MAHLILSRPEKLNALSSEMLRELRDAAAGLGADPNIAGVVVRGAGRCFCAGADVTEMARLNPPTAREFISLIHAALAEIRRIRVPVLAELHGACFGAGLELAASCDVRVAATDAQLGMPEIRVAIPSVIEAALLPRIIGEGRARELLLTGDSVDGETALRIGLANRTAPAERLREETEKLMSAMLRNSNRALRAQKELFAVWESTSLHQSIAYSIELFGRCFENDEPREVMTTLVRELAEKRTGKR